MKIYKIEQCAVITYLREKGLTAKQMHEDMEENLELILSTLIILPHRGGKYYV